MSSSKTRITFLIFFSLVNLLAFARAEGYYPVCGTTGNYTNGSIYETNLNNLLSSLSTNVNEFGFYNASVGQDPDRVNAIAWCRGDLFMCSTCIYNSTIDRLQSCPDTRQAILWNYMCMLRYSDEPIFGTMETQPMRQSYYIASVTSPSEFLRDLETLINLLRVRAANGGSLQKVGFGNISSVDFQIIFAIVECTPDLSSEDCNSCLLRAAQALPGCCGGTRIGVSTYLPSCNMHYQTSSFYNETKLQQLESLSTPPPVPSPTPAPTLQPVLPGPTSSSWRSSPVTKHNNIGMIIGIVVCMVFFLLISFCALLLVQRRKKRRREYRKEFEGIEAKPYTFSYSELKAATNDFNMANKLGQGGFGPVFKGTLSDGRVVAVKQLSVASDHGKSQFVAEIATISAVQHKHLVKLYGCCIKDEKRLLVYEYLENSSLDRALYGNSNLCLDWSTRFNICLGVARGLAYLHEESRPRIVHRDVKASNILLDSQFNPEISDFGLAKLYDDTKTHISTRVAGTIGYLAPEYAIRGHLTEKADVFGFGVVALEIVCGRPNSVPSLEADRVYLLDWVWSFHEKGRGIELVDSNMVEFDEEEVKRVIEVALLCSQALPGSRPSMSRVVAMISGDAEIPPVTSKPTYLADWNFKDTSTFDESDDPLGSKYYNSSLSTTSTAAAQYSPGQASLPMLLNGVDEPHR